ncbi:sigma factor-like helix-turn-helix DNA-binding protein [Stutzerimonas kirkiae]|uniref:RNA polymerase sigma factor 70 region 4 type 2 domain-containing protein n=1 Tax=Stutzerimonas kirkiae TaxID=2211392 RepID=A0A4Q9RER1_9GAMM|nr:sigma factor-like helix-turn-helix DNA-binding protein [Stutzerimonas kirkiae]TBU98680.1 hypothetical protein DNJ96_05425 [Stutzerimonas kirkiae]TBV00224.1 hypothetical protein DNJ95_15430 [Stutzerimonas kirkiae]TBV06044.1 hypothetical protein DNK08_14790 [Stutzerimonas kirkiae]TBV14212.1 hypothetical protein DNK01_09070 [Stutzerimonas kirkiae]
MTTRHTESGTNAWALLEHALSALPRDTSQVFLLRTRERQSVEQIAASLSLAPSEVERQLIEAMTFIRLFRA